MDELHNDISKCNMLVEAVLESVHIEFREHDCGEFISYECSMCGGNIDGDDIHDPNVDDEYILGIIEHSDNCPYIIAKEV